MLFFPYPPLNLWEPANLLDFKQFLKASMIFIHFMNKNSECGAILINIIIIMLIILIIIDIYNAWKKQGINKRKEKC